MSRRNVDLVISAKDEAEKVLRQITSALEDFTSASRGVSGGAEKTESSLGQLGAAIATLQKNLGGLDIADKLDKELRTAGKELDRLDQKFEQTQKEAAELGRSFDRAAAQATRFGDKLAGATAALDRQRSAVSKAKTDQRELSAAYAQAEQAQAKLSARQAALPAQIERQSAALDKARARYADLAAQIERTVSPSKTLQQNFEASARSVDRNVSQLDKLTTEYGRIGGEVRAAGAAMTIFGAQAQRAADSVNRQVTIYNKIDTNLTALNAKTKAAAKQQGSLKKEFDDTTNAMERQQASIAKAEGNYVDLAQSAGLADAALEKLSAQSLGRLGQELQQQRKTALQAKKGYLDLTQEVTRLASEMRQVAEPTAEMQIALDRSKVAASEAKQEYLEQRTALELMGRAYRETGTDISSINATQQRFQTILSDTSGRLTRVASTAQQAQTRLDGLAASTNRAAQAKARAAAEATKLAAANARGASATNRLAQAYRQFYGDTRTSLSLLQRIRGEVLSLVAAYGGLFGAIEVLRGSVSAFQQLEAAQSRLTVAVGGDQAKAAQELDFLRRQADRLGVSFGVLSNEYSKFAIATKGTNLEGAATREIFVSVAEAARVNRSSVDEMSGVFVALTQIVSKGAVQMEELRQQLGDRLPGAVNILADALGVTTAELSKMIEAGEVSSDALLPFARELRERFGSGLTAALTSTSAAIGRLGNEAFEALLRFGQAGFLEAFTDLANTITATLKTADFQAFSDKASAAISKLVRFVGFGIENFKFLAAAVAAFLGLRLTPIVLAIAASFRSFQKDLVATNATLTATGTSASTATGRIAAMGAAVGRLRLALVGLLSTTGIGLLVAGIAAGITLWATEADSATEALIEHQDMVDQVKNIYDQAGGSVRKFGEEVRKAVDPTLARKNLRQIQEAVQSAVDDFELLQIEARAGSFFATGNLAGAGIDKGFIRDIEIVNQAAKDGIFPMKDLGRQIGLVADRYKDSNQATIEYAESLVEAAQEVTGLAESAREQELVLQALTGSVEEQQAALNELNGVVEDNADATDESTESSEAYLAALAAIRDTIPEVKAELDRLEKSEALSKMLQQAIQAAGSWREVGEAIRAAGQAQMNFDAELGRETAAFAQGSTGTEAAASLLRQFEGFRATPYYDVNAFRTGFGSDTITLADGTIKKVTEGMRVSVADANRDLIRRIDSEFGPAAAGAAGQARFDSFSPQQQAALISIAYNYGSIPDRIVEAVRTGTDAQIATAIRGLGGDNNGVNRNRRNQEAALFESGTDVEAQVTAEERLNEERTREAERAAEEREKEREATAARIEDGNFEIEQQRLKNEGLERQAAVEAAIREAKANDPNISEAELETIKQQTEALFDLNKQKKDATTEAEKAAEAEEKVNNLLSLRGALQSQLEQAMKTGEIDQADNLKLKIGEVNAELLAAIENAQRMWQAVGGEAADAAIAKLEVAKIETRNFGVEAGNTYLQWNRVADLFVTGLASAFDTFAQKVAEGESVGEAARQAFLKFASDFLIQIAQMIIQQAIFNALKGAFGGTSFGSMIGLGHTGGLVGSSRVGSGNSSRRVNPAMFASAPRYHSGGMIGLKPGEVPIIAKQGEEMLTRDDPRHMLNGGGQSAPAAGASKPVTIINAFDAEEMMERALSTSKGQDLLINAVRAKRSEIKAAMG